MKIKHILGSLLFTISIQAQTDSTKVPFENYNLRWINGQNRQQDFPLQLKDKNGETVVTGVVYLDGYFNYNFNRPKDNTQTISAVTGRANEFSIALASIGLETNYKNAIGRLWLQTGSMLHIIQETDGSVARGRNTGTGNLKFIREAAAGYHFDVNYGLNVEMGIFMSYIGLESYITQENWSYQRSMVCDFTPFYFQGARVQYFPTKNYRTELWLLNGWQSYNSWSKSPGIGSSNYYRPNENIQLVANFYLGRDSRNPDGSLSDVVRFHHDNSIVYRYYHPENKKHGITQAAFSMNNHYGFQNGPGVSGKSNFMTGSSLAHRIWWNNNRLALTTRADYVTNPGSYLAFTPAQTNSTMPNGYELAMANGEKLRMFQTSATLDWMPSDFVTFRLEYDYRQSNVPYFAGRGGTTSPTGFTTDPIPADWKADLRKQEHRVILAMNFRL